MNEPSFKTLEMGYTAAEFQKTLKGQFIHNTGFSLKELSLQEWIVTIGTGVVCVKISESEPRKIAMLTLPVLNVSFEFHDLSAAEETCFMKTFLRYFHKGGG